MAAAMTVARAIELTPENWENETAGKNLLVTYSGPGCQLCMKIKPENVLDDLQLY